VRTENIVAKLPTGRNTLLLSASMAALYGMVQLSVALSTVIFVPLTAGRSPDAGSPVAPWFAAAVFMAVALALVLSVKPDPRRIAEILAARSHSGGHRATEPAAPLSEILRRRGAVPALLAALTSYSVMVGLMTLSGYILVGHGHHQGAVFPVISAHFIGMFGLVLFVGSIIDRIGRTLALTVGLLLLELVAGQDDLLRVHDDDVGARVGVRGEHRLVLAAEQFGRVRREPAQHHVGRVDHEPLPVDVLRLRAVRAHRYT
jgi:hypothetical protein